jgi:hypothetical protein
MDDSFEIPVTYAGSELLFEARLRPGGYLTLIEIDVKGHTIIFEPDEEGNYRAVIPFGTYINGDEPKSALLAEIAGVLNSFR